jgi:hypothetical protein
MGISHRVETGRVFSEGSRLLWLAVEASGLNLSKAAVRGECSRADFVKYIYGDRRPGRVDAMALLEHFAVPMTAWDAKPSEPFVFPALRPKDPESGHDVSADAANDDAVPKPGETGTGG